MFSRKFCASLVATSLIVVPVQRAQANEAASFLGGALLGGIIVNEVNKNNQRKRAAASTPTRKTYSSGVSSAQREQNRQVQTALNYFGYNVGTVDGSIGSRSRAGISRYQADMGYPPDGNLDDYERDFLLSSHQRALASANVPPYNQILATQGQTALLRTYRNEQLGIATPTPGIQSTTVTMPAPAPAPLPAPVASPTETVMARASTATLPDFSFGQSAPTAAEHCNEINVLTAANGGITASGRVSDPDFALSEQFCLARSTALAESDAIVATIPNLTDDQIAAQCAGLTEVIGPELDALADTRPSKVIADTGGLLQASGKPMPQLVAGGKVCLGVGYRSDDGEMALASALLLAGAGELGYGEVVSHHLREGIGIEQVSPEQADAWMALALNAIENGSGPVLGQAPERVAVLAEAMNGGSAPSGAAALPVFPTAATE